MFNVNGAGIPNHHTDEDYRYQDLLDEDRESNNPMEFEEWLDIFKDDLAEEYIKDNPEDFPTKQSMTEIDKNAEYQEFTESKHTDYWENITR